MENEQPNAITYTSSVKIEQTAKGQAMVSVHVYDTNDISASNRAVETLKMTLDRLKMAGIPVAAEVAK